MTYPEHHDMTGLDVPDRAGDPLVTGDQAVVDLLVRVAYNTHTRTGMRSAPIGEALRDRINNPRPGDPVYVPDSLARRQDDDGRRKGVGYLVVQRTEWFHTEQRWADGAADEWAGDPRPTDRVFYVQYGPDPGDICRWENARCYALPLGDRMMADVDEEARRLVRAARPELFP